MGALALPASGTVYLAANGFIYSIERIDPYRALLDILWQTVSTGQITVVTSELTLLAVLVRPLKVGDAPTATLFRTVLRHTPDVQMVPITQTVLEEAANLRATLGLRTTDGIVNLIKMVEIMTKKILESGASSLFSRLEVRLLCSVLGRSGENSSREKIKLTIPVREMLLSP